MLIKTGPVYCRSQPARLPNPVRNRFAVFLVFSALLLTAPVSLLAADPLPAESDDQLAQLQLRFQAITEKVAPAVVAISASTEPDNSLAASRSSELSPEKLQQFLSHVTRMVGTGFVIDSTGYILTNDHVIDDATQLWVTTDDRKIYPAMVIGSDPRSDLAILKIPARNLPAVRFGNGAAVRRGQWSIAVGNPFGLSGEGGMCVSVGVVSAVNRSLPILSDKENRLYSDLIQTTAQINPGNSGGPLFDLHGDVIGINTAVVMPQKAVNGIAFAMPVTDQTLDILRQLKQGREVQYGYLGVVVSNLTDHDRQTAGLADQSAVRVDSVIADSPTDGVLQSDDLLLAIDQTPITDSRQFVRAIGSAKINQPVALKILRDGRLLIARATVRKRPLPVAAVTQQTQRLRWGGLLLGPAGAEKTADSGFNGVTVISMDASSTFAQHGVHEGSVITALSGRPITSMVQLQSLINETPTDRCTITTAPETATASIATESR